jgi:hypothetical protein
MSATCPVHNMEYYYPPAVPDNQLLGAVMDLIELPHLDSLSSGNVFNIKWIWLVLSNLYIGNILSILMIKVTSPIQHIQSRMPRRRNAEHFAHSTVSSDHFDEAK